ncbi:MAG: tetratricopeptide repeat protein [Leptospiraceae bacterium]|nr:tetratricopeptide repeat protein [Leptospiraceae bacterium]MDW7977063.1 tetratricopeptide repeat protein [Leptospiraceae bacterium]
MTETQKRLLEQYNKALSLYKKRRWEEALKEFEEALKIVPNDGPSLLYIERCKEYIKNPPPEDWDGVFVMKTK